MADKASKNKEKNKKVELDGESLDQTPRREDLLPPSWSKKQDEVSQQDMEDMEDFTSSNKNKE